MKDSYRLTDTEHRIVSDREWIYAKHSITKKIYLLFGELSQHYQLALQLVADLPPEVISVSPKIYKGENYREFPYIMLDHPRYYNGSDSFAIRSLFWWGHSFSIHLVLGGSYKKRYEGLLEGNIGKLPAADWYYSLTNNPWHHHFEADNYLPLPPDGLPGSNEPFDYLKLGRRLSLEGWDKAEHFFTSSFGQLVGLFASDTPSV